MSQWSHDGHMISESGRVLKVSVAAVSFQGVKRLPPWDFEVS